MLSKCKLNLKNEDAPNLETICRLCLEADAGRFDIFEPGQLSIPVRIMACAALEVQHTDGLPRLICDQCRLQLEVSYYFRKKCQVSDSKLRKHIRLINAGKRSRVFLKSTDEDDEDEEELQFEESIKFIREQETKKQREEEEKREKWLAEQQEQVRREETQKLFEEFGNFINNRRQVSKPAANKVAENVEQEVRHPTSQSQAQQQSLKIENEPTDESNTKILQLKTDVQSSPVEAENEITSSEQVPEQQEQVFGYSDDEIENTDGNIETYILYGKDDDEESDQVIEIESERLEDLENDLNQAEEEDGVEDSIELSVTNVDGGEELIFTHEFVDSENRDEDSNRMDNMNVVQSYQIEDNGDIQYLKDEVNTETISVCQDEDVKFMLSNPEISEYQEEEEKEYEAKNKLKRKALDTPSTQPDPKHTVPFSSIKTKYAKISTEDLKIFKCNECPQSFTRENSLQRHWSAHRKGRQYTCSLCNKCFSCKSSLDRHMRVHTGEKPFTCEECGKSYMQKEVLNRHLAIHSGKRPHPCPHCPRAFIQKLMLTEHINATHLESPQIQKHECHLCSKSFNYASGLSRHLITHCGMKFRCTECGRSFNDKSSIRRHVMSVHSKLKEKKSEMPAKAREELDSLTEYNE